MFHDVVFAKGQRDGEDRREVRNQRLYVLFGTRQLFAASPGKVRYEKKE
jgi:hypothetical protein